MTGSSKACQLKCEENFDTCNAALFNSHRQMCQIFEAPDTYSYYQLLVENEEDEGFIKICKTYNSKGKALFVCVGLFIFESFVQGTDHTNCANIHQHSRSNVGRLKGILAALEISYLTYFSR